MRPTRHRRVRSSCVGLLLVAVLSAALVASRSPGGGAAVGQLAGSVPRSTPPGHVALPAPPPPAPAVTAPAPPAPAPAPPPTPAPPTVNLVPPSGQAAFLARVQREALRQVTPYGLPGYGVAGGAPLGPMPAPSPAITVPMTSLAGRPAPASGPPAPTGPSQPTSGTNVQEADVDEPDVVKTDGRVLVSILAGDLQVVDVTGAPRPASRLPLTSGATSLLLVGTRALVFSSVPHGTLPETDVTVIELAEPARPHVVRTHRLAGSLVAARLLGGTARVVLTHVPQIQWVSPADASPRARDAALDRNRQRIRASTFQQWVAPGTGCADAYTSPVESGLATIAVRTIDPVALGPGPGVCVASQASTVYASTGSLYVGTTTFATAEAAAGSRVSGGEPATSLHRFDIADPAAARYTGSGEVRGTLLNQFSLSEHRGDLRVASTRTGVATGSVSQVAVLRPGPSTLDQIGVLGGLGPSEQITGVRFTGDLGYVVTFSRMACDPLFVVDLTDPRRPVLRGALEVQGFSSYLHPTVPGRVLSIGRDQPTPRSPGLPCGTSSPQVSLYDVSQPDRPRQLHRLVLPRGVSEAERDHHGFTYWAPAQLLVIPVGLDGFVGAMALRVTDGGISVLARIAHPGGTVSRWPIRRSFVVGARLLTVSAGGVASHDLGTLADGGFTPLA